MNNIKITYGRTKIACSLPAGWHELTLKDYLKLYRYLLYMDRKPALLLPAVKVLLRRKGRFGKTKTIRRKLFNKLDPVQLLALCKELTWLFTYQRTEPMFTSFWMDNVEYHLPAERLKNISLIEYAFCDFCFNMYMRESKANNKKESKNWLTKLICYLCRPADSRIDSNDASTYKGDIREMFNTEICDRRLPQFETLAEHYVIGVLSFWTSCKRSIYELYKETVFADVGTGTNGGPTEWLDLCFNKAGGKFGTLQQTKYTNLYEVLHELHLTIIKNASK